MPRYRLLAARDGDFIDETADCPDDYVAETWASGLLVLRFGLDCDQYEAFYEFAAEADACELQELADDPIALAATKLISSLATSVAQTWARPAAQRDIASLQIAVAAAELEVALKRDGYRFI